MIKVPKRERLQPLNNIVGNNFAPPDSKRPRHRQHHHSCHHHDHRHCHRRSAKERPNHLYHDHPDVYQRLAETEQELSYAEHQLALQSQEIDWLRQQLSDQTLQGRRSRNDTINVFGNFGIGQFDGRKEKRGRFQRNKNTNGTSYPGDTRQRENPVPGGRKWRQKLGQWRDEYVPAYIGVAGGQVHGRNGRPWRGQLRDI